MFKGNSSKGDYHTEMNGTKCGEMFDSDRTAYKNLKPLSVIVLDKAPYHTAIEVECPMAATIKGHIIQ